MTCESVMHVLRDHKDSLMAVLEAFVYDPLLNWRLVDGKSSLCSCSFTHPCFVQDWLMHGFNMIYLLFSATTKTKTKTNRSDSYSGSQEQGTEKIWFTFDRNNPADLNKAMTLQCAWLRWDQAKAVIARNQILMQIASMPSISFNYCDIYLHLKMFWGNS